jgi:hypothetical protein
MSFIIRTLHQIHYYWSVQIKDGMGRACSMDGRDAHEILDVKPKRE